MIDNMLYTRELGEIYNSEYLLIKELGEKYNILGLAPMLLV
jgi:hypothetical protein